MSTKIKILLSNSFLLLIPLIIPFFYILGIHENNSKLSNLKEIIENVAYPEGTIKLTYTETEIQDTGGSAELCLCSAFQYRGYKGSKSDIENFYRNLSDKKIQYSFIDNPSSLGLKKIPEGYKIYSVYNFEYTSKKGFIFKLCDYTW